MVLVTLFIPIWIYRKQFKQILVFLGTYIFMGIPQLIYNWYINGSIFIFTSGTIERKIIEQRGFFSVFSINNIPYFILRLVNKVPPLLFLFLSLSFVFMLFALIYLYRHQRLSATILVIWIFSFVFFYSCFFGFVNSAFRYLMPVVPAGIIVVSILFLKGQVIIKENLPYFGKIFSFIFPKKIN